MKQPHVCTIKKLPPEKQALAREIAARENIENVVMMAQPYGRVLRAAMQTRSRWANGRTITVSFLGGTTIQRTRVQPYFHEWSKYANIKFQFIDANGEVRVAFDDTDGSWSYLGVGCLTIPPNEHTMNFGWLYDGTAEDEYRRVVLHEVGHALGLEHELQQPSASVKWDVKKVIAYYTGPPNNWTKQDVQENVLTRIPAAGTEYTAFDDHSIMAYSVPAEWTTDGKGVPFNTTLSIVDIDFIGRMYPLDKPVTPEVVLPKLKSGVWLSDAINDVNPIREYEFTADKPGVYRFWTSYAGAPVTIVHASDPNNPVGRGIQQATVRLVPATYRLRVQLSKPGGGAAFRLKYRRIS